MTSLLRPAVVSALVVLSACGPEESPDGTGGSGSVAATFKTRAARVPLMGGTVTTAGGGDFAIVSDPERDLIHVIDARARTVRGTVRLPTGSQPTRGVEDPQGNVRVVLRGTGQVATIGVANATLLRTDSVCPEPRGLGWDGTKSALVVACASGELVTIPTVGSSTVRRLDADLRDVVVTNGKVRVSTFRGAQLLDVGEQVTPVPLPTISLPEVRGQPASFDPAVAWRTVPAPGGLTVMVHQRAVTGDIDAIRTGLPPVAVPYYTNPCDVAVVRSVLTVANDARVLSSIEIGAVLPVDVAVSADGSEVAVVSAGTSELIRLPLPQAMGGITGGVCGPTARTPPPPDVTGRPSHPLGQPVGVAFVANGDLLVHSRSPASVVIIPSRQSGMTAPNVTLKLDGNEDPELPGYRLFHTSSRGLACASCHPEGQEDGHVWTFFARARRTQPLSGGLSETAPFHWKGNLPTMTSLLGDTFVARMGGTMPSPIEVSDLTSFLDAVPAPKPPTREALVDMTKGRAAFDKAGCASCHSGPKLTNRTTTDVGGGEAFQVPSLIGLSRRAPYMHDGCAKTIADRIWDPACGGRSHGDLSVLSKDEVNELIAYLGQL